MIRAYFASSGPEPLTILTISKCLHMKRNCHLDESSLSPDPHPKETLQHCLKSAVHIKQQECLT